MNILYIYFTIRYIITLINNFNNDKIYGCTSCESMNTETIDRQLATGNEYTATIFVIEVTCLDCDNTTTYLK